MNPQQHTSVLDVALAFTDAGCSVIPVATDGTKRPLGQWKNAQTTPLTRAQVQEVFADGHPGLGIVTGAVSGNLLMVELEGRAVADGMLADLREVAMNSGLADLWRRVTTGYLESTPSGGVHLLVRVLAPIGGNEKLARRPGPPDPVTGKPTIEVLAETRGEGGFVVVAPSHGPVHPTGKAWQRAAGSPATIPDLTGDDARALLDLFRALDRMPQPAPLPPRPPADAPRSPADTFLLNGTTVSGGTSPGDDYNARTDWAQILEPHGWRLMREHNGERFWLRPGKQPAGRDDCSATTGYGDRGDWLWVFSTSTEFETETTYSKFAAYTLLEHAGNYTAAAKALRAQGYGTPPQLQTTAPQPEAAASTPDTHQAKDVHDAATSPRDVPAPPPPSGPTATITSDAGLTDVGNADLLVQRHGHELRYVPERGAWLRWGGTHWSWDDAGRVVEAAKATVLAIPDDDDVLRKHRTRSLSRRAIEAMVALARTHPTVVTPAALLDSDPYALCTPGGVVDLLTGRTEPARPEDLHTRCTTAAPRTMPTPRWDAFLADTFGQDLEMQTFVQRLAGYSATGVVTHHVLPFLHGPGGNGKSVFLDVLRRLLGDYAATAPAGFLLAGQQQHETEVARLAGLRMVICSEVNQESRFDEAKVKLLTGGDALTARFMRQDHFTFTPTHHLWLMGNHQPRIGAGGESFARRLRLVPFTNTVPDDKKVDGLDRLLVDQEGPGILAWLIDGARLALADGLRAPASVIAATRVYMDEEDAFARFVEDRCLLGGGAQVRTNTAEVRAAYTRWCNDQGEKAVSPQVFGRELRTRYGVEQVRSHGARFYAGLALMKDEDDEQQDHWTDR